MTQPLISSLDPEMRRTLESVRAAAERIWSCPLHRYYTDHSVRHSERIIELMDGLTEGIMATDSRLSVTEIFVLLAAAYLHDIGMQNERYGGGDLDTIRSDHHEQTAEMIYRVFEDPDHAFPIPLPNDPGVIEAVALVAKGHRRVDLESAEYEPLPHARASMRLRLLAALLRFADELDVTSQRVDLDQMKLLAIPAKSQLHWWRCHYVGAVSISDGLIRIDYQFPLDRESYKDLIIPLVETTIGQRLAELKEIFGCYGVSLALGEPEVRRLRAVRPLPEEVEALARAEVGGFPQQPTAAPEVALPRQLVTAQDDLVEAFRRAGAALRIYPCTIAGIHIERGEVGEIVDWLLHAGDDKRLGILLDQPGGGKTVVMHDVLLHLEAARVPTLAIKADILSGIKDRFHLADRLGLPAPVEKCAQDLAADGQCIILLDQLDALSLLLSRDQATLDIMLDTLARLREIGNVRVLASCRTFDLSYDPRLSKIPVDQRFLLEPLDDQEVNRVLEAIGVEPSGLLPAHQALLAVPLHLGVYAQIIAANSPGQALESYRTLQDLYDALWRQKLESAAESAPPSAKRVAAVYRLVDEMHTAHQLAVPAGVLDEWSEAAAYLEHEGLIQLQGGNWSFPHQTLFDYLYTRRFVAQRRSLAQETLQGTQGLFERSQMVQILAYLRGKDTTAFRRELTALLSASTLRTHLRLLLYAWIASLPDPAGDDVRIARREVRNPGNVPQLLHALRNSENWFDLLGPELARLLKAKDLTVVDAVINYLGAMIERRSKGVLDLLRPYLGKSAAWDARIGFCLCRLEAWQEPVALDVLCDLLARHQMQGQGGLCLYHLAASNPEAGCRALAAYLDERLEALVARESAELAGAELPLDDFRHAGLLNRYAWQRELLGEHSVGTLMDRAIEVCPETMIQHLLPWFLRALSRLGGQAAYSNQYPIDPLFAWGWYGEYISEGAAFAQRIARALERVALTQPAAFRLIAGLIADVEALAAQRILVRGYLADPASYGLDAFHYLVGDPRRLSIGDMGGSDYDSCSLFGAVFRHLDADRRGTLERMVLERSPVWERQGRGREGATLLRFLKCVPPELLSERARRRRHKLELKFPGVERRAPEGIRMEFVGPPIDRQAQEKMSDEDWLGAMRKYDDATEPGAPREAFLGGGIIELSRAFAEQAKAKPERFHLLALERFDDHISLHYVAAAITGLADSDGPAEWVFDLARRFAPRLCGDFRRSVCWALQKRAADGTPDDLLDLMADWALNDPDPEANSPQGESDGDDQSPRGEDPHSRGINSNRGAAVDAVCQCALRRTPPQFERVFQLLERAADDPSIAVRACVVENLGTLLKEDDARAIGVFERLMGGQAQLLHSNVCQHFLYWCYWGQFPRVRVFIESMLAADRDSTRQAGARLACLAALQYPEAGPLADQAMQGDVAMRRGAAQIYARNLVSDELELVCSDRLGALMNDPDDQVRTYVGDCFRHLRPDHLERLRPFIAAFLGSPALVNGAWSLVEYLTPLASDDPDLALLATERILDMLGAQVADIRTAAAVLERDLVRLPLAVYTHSEDLALQSRAMDVFDRLLLIGSGRAQQALSDLDRR